MIVHISDTMFFNFTLKSFGVLGYLIAICSLLFSCAPQVSEKEYFLSQQRDERLTGVWVNLDPFSKQETDFENEYTSKGELYDIYKGKRGKAYYYYTKRNILYMLTLGDGLKVSDRIHKLEYQFSEDNGLLILKELNTPNKEVMIWKRRR